LEPHPHSSVGHGNAHARRHRCCCRAYGQEPSTSFIPEEDQGYAFLQIQLPDAASLQRTDAVMRKIDALLAHTHGVKSFSGISGFSLLSNTSASYTGFYFLQLSLGKSVEPRSFPLMGSFKH